MNIDNSCDIYKERKEMELCGVKGFYKNLKIAEKDYEHKLAEPYIIKENLSDNIEQAEKDYEQKLEGN